MWRFAAGVVVGLSVGVEPPHPRARHPLDRRRQPFARRFEDRGLYRKPARRDPPRSAADHHGHREGGGAVFTTSTMEMSASRPTASAPIVSDMPIALAALVVVIFTTSDSV